MLIWAQVLDFGRLTFLWGGLESILGGLWTSWNITGNGRGDTVRCGLVDRVKSPGTEGIVLGLGDVPVIVRMLGFHPVRRVHSRPVHSRGIHRIRGTNPQIFQNVRTWVLATGARIKSKNFVDGKRRSLCGVWKDVHLGVVPRVHVSVMVLEAHHGLGVVAQKGIHCHYKNWCPPSKVFKG